jgi:biotin synthase
MSCADPLRTAEHSPATTFQAQRPWPNQAATARIEPGQLGVVRNDWSLEEVRALFALPFADLIFHAQSVHRQNFDPNQVQVSTLLSIKTGACPEDCAYCSQSIRFKTGLESEPLMQLDEVLEKARQAKASGATRFCMGAAYRSPKPKQLAQIVEMVKGVRALGMETCATLGMVTPDQARELKQAGLDYYNHNLDTSESHYAKVITTRTYQDRLDTLQAVREAGINVCCGGILGLGETQLDRAQLLHTLATLPEHPQSVPINQLMQVPGTPLHGAEAPDPLDFVRVVAVARLLMPRAHVRLSAGRNEMSDETQALCFLAGANSIFYGEKLLTTDNPDQHHDHRLFERLGIRPEARPQCASAEAD